MCALFGYISVPWVQDKHDYFIGIFLKVVLKLGLKLCILKNLEVLCGHMYF